MARILIVDDDTAFRESLAEMLGDLGHAVSAAPTVAAGLQVLQGGSVDVAIVDLRMPGEDGLASLRKARGLSRAPCIMLTAYASGSNTIEAMRLGAFDHLTKPIARTSLVEVLERALLSAGQAGSPENAAQNPAQNQEPEGDDAELVSGSEAMRQVFKRIGLAADSDATVLVLGETGTGKELVARALHRNSARAERPFVAVNCAAIPADLMESELFGHVKGAFTGAASDRAGRFREAQGGTLFLDEVGDMPLPTQAKILRALHERLGDVLLLAEHFLRQGGGASPKRLGADAAQLLLAHDWPGNVRELRNAMERAALLCPGPVIGAEHIGLQPAAAHGPAIDWNGPLAAAVAQLEREMVTRALAAATGNRAEAARRLGLSRQQLYRKLAEFGLG